MAQLTVLFPGTTPSSWWEQDPRDIVTVLAALEARSA